MFRKEDDLISLLCTKISEPFFSEILRSSYPLFDTDGGKWEIVINDSPSKRDEILMLASEILNE